MKKHDLNELAAQVGRQLSAHKQILVTAESCTGGGIAQAITDIAGSSHWFERGFITYSNKSKHDMLNVSGRILLEHGAVSRQTAEAMALGALQNSTGTLAVSVTGIAGPDGGSRYRPVGTVWLAWALRDHEGEIVLKKDKFKGNRHDIRKQAVMAALEGICHLLEEKSSQAD